jgi:hypothetical protein
MGAGLAGGRLGDTLVHHSGQYEARRFVAQSKREDKSKD